MPEAPSNMALIREYFGTSRKVSMDELKDLSKEEREELGEMIRELPQYR